MLEYSGVFSYKFMIEFGERFTAAFEDKLPNKVFRASYFVLNELTQNVSYYSEQKEKLDDKIYGCGKITVEISDDHILFTTINPISNDTAARLQSKLDIYNNLSPEELKQLSKEKRKLDQENESKGGGIGLIEIIRKSKSKIEYKIVDEEETKKIKINVNIKLGD